MASLTIAAALALATSCQSLVDPWSIVGQAKRESGLDPAAIHSNKNGSRDYGLMQINSTNLVWLGLTPQTALDPCQSIGAAARLIAILSRYNSGSPVRSIEYAQGVIAETDKLKASGAQPPPDAAAEDQSDPKPPAWDLEAIALWRERHGPTQEPPEQTTAPDDSEPDPVVVAVVRKKT